MRAIGPGNVPFYGIVRIIEARAFARRRLLPARGFWRSSGGKDRRPILLIRQVRSRCRFCTCRIARRAGDVATRRAIIETATGQVPPTCLTICLTTRKSRWRSASAPPATKMEGKDSRTAAVVNNRILLCRENVPADYERAAAQRKR